MSYDNNNEGAIWKNEDKQKDTQPDFKGNAVIEGVEYWVSGWKRLPDANPKAPALKFKLTAKQAVAAQGKAKVEQAMEASFDDELIPF